MSKADAKKPYMVVLAIVLIGLAVFLGARAIGVIGGSGGEPDIEAMMPKTGQETPVTPEEIANAPKGVLPGEKH